MPSTEIPERTLAELEAELAAARLAVAAAEAEERQAFDLVSASRERHALGEIDRKAFLVFQRSLSDAQESAENARAKVRALDRAAVQLREAQTAIERRAKAEADRRLAERGVALAGRVGVALTDIESQLDSCSRAIAAWHAERGANQPTTDLVRERTWTQATDAIASLRRMYPVQINTRQEG